MHDRDAPTSDASASERFVTIAAPSGRLPGILCRPDQARSRVAVLFAPSGSRDRCGPSRLAVRLARSLALAGHASLRFDAWGSGEAIRNVAPTDRRKWILGIQRGAGVEDLEAAAHRLARETDRERVVVFGAYSGGQTGAWLAARHPALVEGVFALGMPPLDVAAAQETSQPPPAPPSHPPESSVGILQRLVRPEVWASLARGDTDYRSFVEGLRSLFQGDLPAWLRTLLGGGSESPVTARREAATTRSDLVPWLAQLEALDPRVNRPAFEALARLRLRGGAVALAYGALDPACEVLADLVLDPAPALAVLFERFVIDDAEPECARAGAFEALATHVQGFLRTMAPPQPVAEPLAAALFDGRPRTRATRS